MKARFVNHWANIGWRERWLRLAILAFACLFAWQASVSARHGWSDLTARPAIDYLEQTRFEDYELSDEEWQAIESAIARATELMPSNPQYLESLGWLHQIKLAMNEDLAIDSLAYHADAATRYFEDALAQRPTWPYYWGNLALEQYALGNVASAKFQTAIANAARFGPWKNDTQRLVADLAIDAWRFLSPEAREQVLLAVDRGLRRQRENTITLISLDNGWPIVCGATERPGGLDISDLVKHCEELAYANGS